MDFLTATAYILILVLVLANALLVRRITISIRDDDPS